MAIIPDTRRTPRPSRREQFDAALKGILSRHGHPHGLSGFDLSVTDEGEMAVTITPDRIASVETDWITFALIGVVLADAIENIKAFGPLKWDDQP